MLVFTALWAALVFSNARRSTHSQGCLPRDNPRLLFGGKWLQSESQGIQGSSCRFSSNSHDAETNPLYLNLSVNGIRYTVKRSLLLRFADSLFGQMLKTGWNEDTDAVVATRRNGELFKYVYDYMFYGKLPRNELGISLIGNASLLTELIQEADFYELPGLMTECKMLLQTSEAEQILKHYAEVLDKIEEAKTTIGRQRRQDYNVVYKKAGPDSLISLLRSKPYAKAWVTGTLPNNLDPMIFMSTTVQNVNVPELLAAAIPSPFGRGTETIVDKSVRDSMEIPASKLGDLTELVDGIDISKLAPNMQLKLKPYKLVIYQEGGHFDNHRDTVRDERHIGTLVLILNSEYAGGELEVSHGQEKVAVTGALNWVAMYGDCVHTIRPVVSGTRVSLIFDIWNESDNLASSPTDSQLDVNDNYQKARFQYDDYEEEKYEEKFWPQKKVNTRFWRGGTKRKSLKNAAPLAPMVGLVDVWERIYGALDKLLEKYATVSICLEHLYPACQANPDFLKGEDYMLYQMLQGRYSCRVTAFTLARCVSYTDGTSIGYKEFGSDSLLNARDDVLFIPNALDNGSVLSYTPGVDNTGNESQDQELVYLAAALVVRKQ